MRSNGKALLGGDLQRTGNGIAIFGNASQRQGCEGLRDAKEKL